MKPSFILGCLVALGAATLGAQQGSGGAVTAETLKGLSFRSIGPFITTGRISDVDIDPKNPNVWYVASASGGLFKTENRGNTFTPSLRRRRLLLARRGHRRSEGLQHRLARHRREQQPAQRRVRRRHLQVHRCRQDVEADGARELRAHPEHRRRSAQLEHRLRHRHRSAVERRAATAGSTRRRTAARRGRPCCTVSDDTGAHRHGDGSAASPTRSTSPMLQRRRQVGQLIGGGPDSGLYKIDGRRPAIHEADKGSAHRGDGTYRARHQPEESEYRLRTRHRAERTGRILPIG